LAAAAVSGWEVVAVSGLAAAAVLD